MPVRLDLLFVYDHTFYESGGVVYSSGAFSYEIWGRYLKRFDRVTVVANLGDISEVDKKQLNVVSGDNVTFEFLPNHRKFYPYFKSFLVPDKRLKALITKHSAIICRVPGELASVAANWCLRIHKPLALEVVGCPWDAYRNHGSIAGKLIAPHAYFRMRRIIQQSRFVLYVSQKFLQRRYPTDGIQVGVSNVVVHHISNPDTYFPQVPLQIGMVAGLDLKYKGFQQALAALGKVKDEVPPFKLKLVGPGSAEWLFPLIRREGLEEHVEIVGKLRGGNAVFNFLDSLDLYLHPSLLEGLPRSLVEAMSRARPVLASSAGGIPELLPEKHLHQPGDVEAFSNQLREVMTNPEKLQNMSRENAQTAQAYLEERLEAKRSAFFARFATHARQKATQK